MNSIFLESENMGFGGNSDDFFGENQNNTQKQKRQNFNLENNLTLERSLRNLFLTMKPSFLQKIINSHLIRQVFLSDNISSPAFLLKKDTTTILIGTGFSSYEIAGKQYVTFPDFRLAFSEKSHISAWILWEEDINVPVFVSLATVFDFPPIFTTRDIIAKFRNSGISEEVLQKFRFIDIFSYETCMRNIDGIEFFVAKNSNKNILAFQSEGITFGYDFITFDTASTKNKVDNLIAINKTGFSIGEQSFISGEIIEILGSKISKNVMKFVLDTFVIDENSVSTTSGYLLSDREMLSKNGVLLFTFEENEQLHTISGHIFIESRGFVPSHEVMSVHKEIVKSVRIIYEQAREKNPNIDRGSLVQILKKELAKYIFLLTKKTPIIMPIIISKN